MSKPATRLGCRSAGFCARHTPSARATAKAAASKPVRACSKPNKSQDTNGGCCSCGCDDWRLEDTPTATEGSEGCFPSSPLDIALFCPPKAPSRVRLPWRDLGIVEQEATRARGQALALSAYVCRAPVQAAVLQELVRHCVCCDCSPGAAAAGGVLFRPRSAGKRGSRRVRSAATSNRQHGLADDRL